MRLSLQDLARALNGRIVQGDYVRAPAPGHSAKDNSLSIKLADSPQGFVFNAFSPKDDRRAVRAYIVERLKAYVPGYQHGNHRPPQLSGADVVRMLTQSTPKAKLIATYDYADATGTLIYQVCRFEPKTFKHRMPDGNGGWTWKGSERRVVYRWPDLIKYPDATIFITEGEKDADNVAALDLCATTVASGRWTQECIDALADRHIYILQDVDEAGAAKAEEAAQLLDAVRASVKIVSLPGLDGTKDNKDITDWLQQGHTKAELEDVCADAPYWEGPIEF
jgi:hypothetical protein